MALKTSLYGHAVSKTPEFSAEEVINPKEQAVYQLGGVGRFPSYAQNKINRNMTICKSGSYTLGGSYLLHLHNPAATMRPSEGSRILRRHQVTVSVGKDMVMRVLSVLLLLLLVSCRPTPEDFLLAARQGEVDQIHRLLNRGLPIAVTDRDGRTALHLAARWGREGVATVLLDRGAPVEATDQEGRTPLHLAAKENQETVTTLLLDRGAQPGATDRYGLTPLHLAAEWNSGNAAQILIARGSAVNAIDTEGLTPLHVAAAWGALRVATLLLDTGARLDAAGHHGQTPLHLTAKGSRRLFETTSERLGVARLLLDRGAPVHAVMQDGVTPLHMASREGDVELVGLLLDRGASIDGKTEQGLAPLHEAVIHNQIEVVRLLLDRRGNIELPDKRRKVPLHHAAELGQELMVRLLLGKGASVRALDAEGRTPLHEPSGRGHETVARLLLDRGAAVDATDHKQWTPLHLATFHGRESIVKLLLDRGAQVNRGDADGVMPLHAASFYGYEGIQQLLIQRGAATDLVDDRGYTPAQYAKSQAREAVDSPPAEGAVSVASAARTGQPRLHLPLIKIDGSSTVYPISALVAEHHTEATGSSVRVTVGVSGTGGGFQKFCRGETDIQDASRPIAAAELELCQANSIQFFELPIGYDALSVVVSTSNAWVESLSLGELKTIWEPGAQMKITLWNQIKREWPALPLHLFGAGPDSGSFDYFTEVVVGKAKASRADYTASEDDNVLVDAIADSRHALGYVPFAYLEPNRRRLKAVGIDAGKGPVLPTKETVLSGQYQPLSRPIFIYVNQRAANNSEVRRFVEYYLAVASQTVEEVRYIPFPDKAYASILSQFQKGRLGTVFGGKSPIGMTIEQFLLLQAAT